MVDELVSRIKELCAMADTMKSENDALRAEIERLREALVSSTEQLDAMNQSASHAASWVEPRSHATSEQIILNRAILTSTLKE